MQNHRATFPRAEARGKVGVPSRVTWQQTTIVKCYACRDLPKRDPNMDASDLFTLPDGRLRAGFRLLLFLFFLIVALLIFRSLFHVLISHPTGISQLGVLVMV